MGFEQCVNNDLSGSMKNNKILFFSHGRGWFEYFRELLIEKCYIFSIVKPAVGIVEVVGDIDSLVSE